MPKVRGLMAASQSIMETEKELMLSTAMICLALASVLLLLLCVRELLAMQGGHHSDNTQLHGVWIIPRQQEVPHMPTSPTYPVYPYTLENKLKLGRSSDTVLDGSNSDSLQIGAMESAIGNGE